MTETEPQAPTGADLHIEPGSHAEALAAACAHQAAAGAMQVHAYDAPATVAGQGTLFREWDARGLQADTVLIAVGGGLIAGALAWWGGARQVVAVEPENAPALNRALAEGPDAEVAVSGIAADALGGRDAFGGIAEGVAARFVFRCGSEL